MISKKRRQHNRMKQRYDRKSTAIGKDYNRSSKMKLGSKKEARRQGSTQQSKSVRKYEIANSGRNAKYKMYKTRNESMKQENNAANVQTRKGPLQGKNRT